MADTAPHLCFFFSHNPPQEHRSESHHVFVTKTMSTSSHIPAAASSALNISIPTCFRSSGTSSRRTCSPFLHFPSKGSLAWFRISTRKKNQTVRNTQLAGSSNKLTHRTQPESFRPFVSNFSAGLGRTCCSVLLLFVSYCRYESFKLPYVRDFNAVLQPAACDCPQQAVGWMKIAAIGLVGFLVAAF